MERTRHGRVARRDPFHDPGRVLPVRLEALEQFSMVSTKLHVASVQASDRVDQVCRLEKVDSHKALMAMLFGNGAIIYHIDSIVLDRVEDVLVCVPVEHDDMELSKFRQVIVPWSPEGGQGSKWRQSIASVRGLDQVAEAIEVFALGRVQTKPRECCSDGLIVSVTLIPNWYTFGHRWKIIEEPLIVRLLPVRCHGSDAR